MCDGGSKAGSGARAIAVQPVRRHRPPFKGTKGVCCIDLGIEEAVRILWENGVETTESCEGGPGHSFYEPTVRFSGGQGEGFRALGIALKHGLKVADLRRRWSIEDGEPRGPEWEMTFCSRYWLKWSGYDLTASGRRALRRRTAAVNRERR